MQTMRPAIKYANNHAFEGRDPSYTTTSRPSNVPAPHSWTFQISTMLWRCSHTQNRAWSCKPDWQTMLLPDFLQFTEVQATLSGQGPCLLREQTFPLLHRLLLWSEALSPLKPISVNRQTVLAHSIRLSAPDRLRFDIQSLFIPLTLCIIWKSLALSRKGLTILLSNHMLTLCIMRL